MQYLHPANQTLPIKTPGFPPQMSPSHTCSFTLNKKTLERALFLTPKKHVEETFNFNTIQAFSLWEPKLGVPDHVLVESFNLAVCATTGVRSRDTLWQDDGRSVNEVVRRLLVLRWILFTRPSEIPSCRSDSYGCEEWHRHQQSLPWSVNPTLRHPWWPTASDAAWYAWPSGLY